MATCSTYPGLLDTDLTGTSVVSDHHSHNDAFEAFGELSRTRGDESMRRWIKLIQQRVSGYWVGIDETGGWVTETAVGIALGTSPGGLHAFLALLELPLPDLQGELAARLESKLLSADAARTFPWVALATLGLQSGAYWASKALNWLDVLGPDEHVAAQLRLVAENKKVPQQVRQHATRLLRRTQGEAPSA